MFVEMKGDLPEGRFATMIPSISQNTKEPFISWMPNGPYLQSIANEEVVGEFIGKILGQYPDIPFSGITIKDQSTKGFCESLLKAVDSNKCSGIINWTAPNKEVTIPRDQLVEALDGHMQIHNLGLDLQYDPWIDKEHTDEATGYLIIPKGNPKIHIYNLSMGGMGLIVHRHHDCALQHAEIIERAKIVSQVDKLQVASLTYPNKFAYMSFLAKILNKRKAHGIWTCNNRNEARFMPRKDVFAMSIDRSQEHE
jgi:hypothetical protein